MAEALVAGAVLSAVFNVLFEKMASPEVVNFFKQRKLDEKLLQKLKTRMNTVDGLLADAEAQQISSQAVKNWVDDLKDVAYEIDDFLDEIAYRALEQQQMEVEARSPKTCTDQVRSFFSSINPCKKGMGEMQPRLEEIFDRVEDLFKQTSTLGLVAQAGKRPDHASSSSQYRPVMTSRLVDPFVYGRDNDKEAIIRLLLSDDAKGKHPAVIPIVGMGGLGKTTLAQLVFKDSRVKQRFDDQHRVWVCVSEESNIFKVTKDILKEFHVPECDSLTPNQLQDKLEEKVGGERVLLVLDDIWSEGADWKSLLALFSSAAKGSKVLITTRFEQVALAMSSVPSHRLEVLNEDDCWRLFAGHAFEGGVADAYGELEEIGKEIARKCDGLPLAAKALGSLLHGKKNGAEWKSILRSNMWEMSNDKIFPALRLSYHYLPSHLKQCFAYCALFPKDFGFYKEDLVLLWIAEGFIAQTNRRRDMEDIGNVYFEELARRSFFTLYIGELFVMHDLIHDLAKSIAGQFFCNMEGVASQEGSYSERTRHLFCIQDRSNPMEQLKSLSQVRSLRTLIIYTEDNNISGAGESFSFWSRFGRLRVLDLSFYNDATEEVINISGLVGTLKYLRFMRLRVSSMLSLPDVASSRFLQTLILDRCRNLTVLDSIGNLKELRRLEIVKTPIQQLPESICGLYKLEILKLHECGQLAELPEKMADLVNLCNLEIRGTGLKYMPVGMGKLVKLQNLTDFFVGEQQRGSGLGELGEFRDLQGALALRNLENVVDEGDALRANLKEKKGLQQLSYLWGDGDDADSSDGSLDVSLLQHLQPHSNVQGIEIEGFRGRSFPNWVGDSSYSNLVNLMLEGCRYCTHLPPVGQLPSLEVLWIERFDSVVSVGAEFYGGGGSCKSSIQPFQSLKSLYIEKMPGWEEWISDDDERQGGKRAFPVLEDLRLESCPELRRVNQLFLPCLVELGLLGCPKLTFPIHLSLPSLVDLALVDCSSSLLLDWGLDKLSSLSILGLNSIQDVESFPGRISLPSSLTKITIRNLQNLKSLDYNGLHHLNSLKSLSISNCPELQCLPEQGLPSSLSYLEIYGCPVLQRRCQRGKGEDWPKISRIPQTDIPAPSDNNESEDEEQDDN